MIVHEDNVNSTTKKKQICQNDHDSVSNTSPHAPTIAETSQSRDDALEIEIERLKLERDRMIVLLEEVETRRDEAVAWLKREIETYHALKKALRKVKEEERPRNE